jgi:cellulose 1,4-beta-cellobiosidase
MAASTSVMLACAPKPAPEPATPTSVATTETPESPQAGMPVPPPRAAPAPAGVNPFVGAEPYVNPDYAEKVAKTIASHPELKTKLQPLTLAPTALWLDNIQAAGTVAGTMSRVVAKAAETGKKQLPVFVVYDLPNRDCSAKASAGELSIEADGERRYREEFIEPIASAFAAHPAQRAVVILEPDSLANVVTNLGVPKCRDSQGVYERSIAYAISRLSMPNVFIYVDSAHAGWLGWDGNRAGMADVIKRVALLAGGLERITGFATNVSNYTPLDGDDGRKLEPSNPCPNELTFVEKLSATFEAKGIGGKGFIIDSARNGKHGVRSRWGSWCNIRGAGLGERPRAAPTPLVHAYYWVKPPGESDGTADPTRARFDENCASADASPGAPEAGQWFEPYFIELAKNANPPL